jgi:hypothetical protein
VRAFRRFTDEQHPLFGCELGQVLLGEILLALSLLELDEVYAFALGERLDVLDELAAHRRHESGGRE